ncbi:MAG: V-type ATP synthase subunit I [Sedimentisphaerales bacterium]|nr:V-type ATP synthase subunit I [Sedimentisphaerales bacterium]
MAVARMAKCLIVIHRSQVSDLLEALQAVGICHLLNAKEATVARLLEQPGSVERPRDIEQLIARLERAIGTLTPLAPPGAKGLTAALAPRVVMDPKDYQRIVTDPHLLEVLDQTEQVEAAMEKAKAQLEAAQTSIDMLTPWVGLDCPIEQLRSLNKVTCWTGLVTLGKMEDLRSKIANLDGVIQQLGTVGNKAACVILAIKGQTDKVQSALRQVEFEQVNFESATGTIRQLIEQARQRLAEARQQLGICQEKAVELARHVQALRILHDHYSNLVRREQVKADAPATRSTVLLEGWVKKKDLGRLGQIVGSFPAASLTRLEPQPGEEIPVDIENRPLVRPFEVITRLYGMPRYLEVDPTAILAPFFALFFGICLGDAGYGLVLMAMMALFIKKAQADKRFLWLLWACGALTVLAGALTGSWFGDAIQQFAPALEPVRRSLMWFDPFKKPMQLFLISVALGYIQIMTGLITAFVWNITHRNYVAAIFDQLTWLGLINSVVVFALSKASVLPASLAVAGPLALIFALGLVLGSHREGGWGARIGMGIYNLFSSIFYVGDLLSYLRLMGLCMVGAGLGMAINLMAGIAAQIPYGLGIFCAIMVFVGGHLFNLVMSGLGAFVHTLRLQYVEFFPKFFVGGGRPFEPLTKQYRYVYIKDH